MNIEAAPQRSLVKTLPGFTGTFPSKHYAGYVTIDDGYDQPSKNLYYYFVLSERNPSVDPVVLWLNGGPGCSSFDGFVYEHGPFNFDAAKQPGGMPTLRLNPYSWSKVSSIIYLDSPAGVGFSYSYNTSIYQTGDLKTAYDTHLFLLKWFEQFPEFVGNEFYIAGESFAGIYVPTLASDVHKGIKSGVKPVINFKGYMIGNGVCDPGFDGNALVPFTHGMGLISDNLFKAAVVACKGHYHNYGNNIDCELALTKIEKALDGLNIYNILEPCYHSPTGAQGNTSSQLPESFKQLGMSSDKPLSVRKRMFGRAWPFRAPVKDGIVPLWPQLMENVHVPCIDDRVATTWLNNKQVRKAIHADPGAGHTVPEYKPQESLDFYSRWLQGQNI
ncbi:Serine carboxypeptidase-like 20 [Forsythia ovata]|uniref:Serine carboxypeptidase-like 20 n=1 Tax=Forsythia ovata TaxID=205694 RepID=A0ABD1X3A4_9LAMI